MALWGAFSTASGAMMAHGHHINQIGVNIANMNTTSYKEVKTSYQTLMAHATPRAEYYTTQPLDTRRVDVQGVVVGTGRRHDLALNGRGFFVTNTEPDGSGDTYYTRDGAFTGRSYQLATDSDGDGQRDRGTYLITQQGHYVMGWPANADGTFPSAAGQLTAVSLNHNAIEPGQATRTITMGANVPNNNGQSGQVYRTTLNTVSTGTENGVPVAARHDLVMTWTKVVGTPNTWTIGVSGDDLASATLSETTVRFNGDGTLDTANGPSAITLDLAWTDGTDPTTVTLDISDVTQFSSSEGLTVNRIEQDGYLTGRLQETWFNEQGVLYGTYSNGHTRALYKLPVATFAAPNSLEAYNGNAYRPTQESGEATLTAIEETHGVASVVAGALEQSNVDLEDQFTRMISTQKAYSSAATVFRTSDEMVQEAGGMKS